MIRAVDSFLLIYATLVFSSVVTLSVIGVDRLDLYVVLFAIEFFIASELAPGFSVTELRRKTMAQTAFLVIFAMIVIERVLEIFRQ